MNRYEKPTGGVEARVQYLDGEYRVLKPGFYVVCAVSGQPIPLDDLRYWNVDRQEAYASPAEVMRRMRQIEG